MKRIERENRQGSEDAVYSIGTVARMLNLHQQTIREYEREGLVHPKRTQGGTRLYSEADVERIRLISYLTQELGINLAGVEVILRMKEELEEMRRITKLIIDQLDEPLRERIIAILEGRTEGLLQASGIKAGIILSRKIATEGDEKK